MTTSNRYRQTERKRQQTTLKQHFLRAGTITQRRYFSQQHESKRLVLQAGGCSSSQAQARVSLSHHHLHNIKMKKKGYTTFGLHSTHLFGRRVKTTEPSSSRPHPTLSQLKRTKQQKRNEVDRYPTKTRSDKKRRSRHHHSKKKKKNRNESSVRAYPASRSTAASLN